MPATTLQSSSDRMMMAITARGHGQGVRSMARNRCDWTRSAWAPMTFGSAEVPTTFLVMGTRYPHTMRRRHQHRFSVPVQVGKQQVANAISHGEICEDDVVNALRWKGLR